MLKHDQIEQQTQLDAHPELPVDPDVVLTRPQVTIHLARTYQLTVFIGGCLGALTRYTITLLLPTKTDQWPMATFIVNMLGALALGVLLEGLARSGPDVGLRRFLRLGIGTGFIGAFTTYSTLAVDADLLVRNGDPVRAGVYTLISVVGGILLSALGIWLAGTHHKLRTRQSI
ncbi:MAG TPA: CrcB family protein [Verrucomicrobiae bacterium]|nr:CrcB family protein [Verrucomicrobiae bacterium]